MDEFHKLIKYFKGKWFELDFKCRKEKTYCIFYSVHGNWSNKNTSNSIKFITYYFRTQNFDTLMVNSLFVLKRMNEVKDIEVLKALSVVYTKYILSNGVGCDHLESK